VWVLDVEPVVLAGLVPRLGADIPVCLARVPTRMGRVREILTAAPLLPPPG
jgi:4-diphosphocytidyl-2C-methyl-D-erythritol kinase